MTKQRPKQPSARSKTKATPAELGRQLARFDKDLVKLVSERAKVAAELAKTEDPEKYNAAAEAAQMNEALAQNKGPLDEHCVRSILRELTSGCRRLVHPLKAAFLGPEYSYSHLAAIERFGGSAHLTPVATIGAVFEEVNRKQSDFGLVPIENSTDGRIVDTLELLSRLPVKVCGEVQLRIHHYLLGNCPQGDVSQVFSKPQALSQCRNWLARHVPEARLVEMTSTTAAAQLAASTPGSAAVASMQAGVHYGLGVIAKEIEDNKHNITRFAVIGHEVPRRTGNDKTALLFELPHQPGALADAMMVFKKNRLNLTWIESLPIPGVQNEYLFFVELLGHLDEMKIKRALAALEKKTDRLVVLGSFQKTEPVQ